MNAVKAIGVECGVMIEKMRATPEFDKRWVSIAETHLQQGIMAARACNRSTDDASDHDRNSQRGREAVATDAARRDRRRRLRGCRKRSGEGRERRGRAARHPEKQRGGRRARAGARGDGGRRMMDRIATFLGGCVGLAVVAAGIGAALGAGVWAFRFVAGL
jgi:hypothetical protein